MTPLRTKVQNALDETRMLVLGLQVLIGFGFQAVFEARFDSLAPPVQRLKLASLCCVLLALGLMLAPAPNHQIAEAGRDTRRFHSFVTVLASLALFPFLTALGLDIAVATLIVVGKTAAVVLGVGAASIALTCWYGAELFARRREQGGPAMAGDEETQLDEKIRQTLTEARVVLPGAQALLGFQFACILTDAFGRLSRVSQYVHLAGLSCVALSIVLLITPAAWHRLVERGESTEGFHRLASIVLLSALFPLAIGVSADFYVVVAKVIGSASVGVAAAASLFVYFCLLWFGLGLWRRHTNARRARHQRPA
jgi:predicted permease